MNKSYRDLVAWQKAMDLVNAIYEITALFPKEELYGLTSQLRRAAVSVPSNIAEGQGRRGPVEFKHFLETSQRLANGVRDASDDCGTVMLRHPGLGHWNSGTLR